MDTRDEKSGTSLIRILCFHLPHEVSQPMFKEYNDRWAEILSIWDSKKECYISLSEHQSAIRTLLAMSTFYRRVIGCLGGALDFYRRISYEGHERKERAVKIGGFILDQEKNNQLWKITRNFSNIKQKYNIPDVFFEYEDTLEFLRNCLQLYQIEDGKSE